MVAAARQIEVVTRQDSNVVVQCLIRSLLRVARKVDGSVRTRSLLAAPYGRVTQADWFFLKLNKDHQYFIPALPRERRPTVMRMRHCLRTRSILDPGGPGQNPPCFEVLKRINWAIYVDQTLAHEQAGLGTTSPSASSSTFAGVPDVPGALRFCPDFEPCPSGALGVFHPLSIVHEDLAFAVLLFYPSPVHGQIYGFRINDRTELTMAEVSRNWKLTEPAFTDGPFMHKECFRGGSRKFEQGYVTMLHREPRVLEARKLCSGVWIGGSVEEAAKLVAEGQADPNDFRFYVGHSEWSQTELDTHVSKTQLLKLAEVIPSTRPAHGNLKRTLADWVFASDPVEHLWASAWKALGQSEGYDDLVGWSHAWGGRLSAKSNAVLQAYAHHCVPDDAFLTATVQ